MDARKEKIASFAKNRTRDAKGHFVKAETDIKTPLDSSNSLRAGALSSPSADSSEDNIVDVKVRNPLKKITKILEDIKKHQNTSFAIKFSIPLIALPVFLFIVFQLGRAQTACVESFSSKKGEFQVIEVLVPKENPGFFSRIFSFFPSIPNLTPKSELVPEKRAILTDSEGSTFNVIYPAGFLVEVYSGQEVVITGNISACTNTIALDTLQNIVTAR